MKTAAVLLNPHNLIQRELRRAPTIRERHR